MTVDMPVVHDNVANLPLLYLTQAEVARLMPALETRLELTEEALASTFTGLGKLPPKLGIEPRPGSDLDAMPASHAPTRSLGLKWICTFPENRAMGIPAIDGLIVLNDWDTGRPICVMDGRVVTAHRTADVSGVAIRRFADPKSHHVAVLGAGVQARTHMQVIASLLPDSQVRLFDRHPDRAEALARQFNDQTPERPWIEVMSTAEDAVRGADIVVSLASIGSMRQALPAGTFQPGALILGVDKDTYVPAETALRAAAFVTDDLGRYAINATAGEFPGYPPPSMSFGQALVERLAHARLGDRTIVVSPLGAGIVDVVIAGHIHTRARQLDVGKTLDR